MTVHTNAIIVTIRISIAGVICGGGNTDVCPGWQTTMHRHCTYGKHSCCVCVLNACFVSSICDKWFMSLSSLFYYLTVATATYAAAAFSLRITDLFLGLVDNCSRFTWARCCS